MVRVYDRLELIGLDGTAIALAQRELFESAVVMWREALLALGLARREVERVEREYRERDAERLQKQSETGDIRAAQDRMFKVGQPLEDEEAREPG